MQYQTDITLVSTLSIWPRKAHGNHGLEFFDEVFRRSVLANCPYGQFRFLNLDALIAAKEAAGREHDLLAAKRLRAVKERLERKKE